MTPAGLIPRTKRFTVSGLYRVGNLLGNLRMRGRKVLAVQAFKK